MTRAQPLVDMLPRLAARQGRVAGVYNAAGLLATALVGAALVHVLAYHVPVGAPTSGWVATALALLATCPLLGPLALILAIAALAPLLAFGEVRRLTRLNVALAVRLARRRIAIPTAGDAVPRSPHRLTGLFAMVLALQVALLHVAGMVCPMQMAMIMDGKPMLMALTPALPLGLLHLVVAGLLAMVIWRFERRLTRLRAQIARQLRLLFPQRPGGCGQPPLPGAVRLPLGRYGAALFARPPPQAA